MIFQKTALLKSLVSFLSKKCVLMMEEGAVKMSSLSNSETYTPGTHSVAYITVPDEKVAKTISHRLVTAKLAACVNIIPKITSVYEWKGEINEDSEYLLMIKTRTSKLDQLNELVRQIHPYEVFEMISLPIQAGNLQYLNWVSVSVPT